MHPVRHLTYSPNGGAAIAARRLCAALQSAGVDSDMIFAVDPKDTSGATFLPHRSGGGRAISKEWARHLRRKDGRNELLSLGMVKSGRAEQLNQNDARILNLHWINNDMLSIRDIGALRHPIVWTLHDMWAFSGASHYSEDDDWQTGYADRPRGDLDRRIWRAKARHWTRPMQIVCPSQWLADCVGRSALMGGWPVSVIPNCIDLELWHPMSRDAARHALKLDTQDDVIAFGAMGGDSDPRKGFAALRDALKQLRDAGRKITLLVFGAEQADDTEPLPFPARYAGHLDDPKALQRVYAAADLFALPSRQDNLPNTGVEALACGIPIVGFQIGGLPDLVPSRDQGALARPFDVADLAQALVSVLDRQKTQPDTMARAARTHAENMFAPSRVSAMYRELYEKISAETAH